VIAASGNEPQILIPGLRLNLSKSGASLSIGHRGFWYTVGPKGRRATIGLPGPACTTQKRIRPRIRHPPARPPNIIPHNGPAPPPTRGEQAAFLVVIIIMVGLVAFAVASASH
jgi:hypothetical protein